LAGGYATRLRPMSYALPKLLFPVAGRPILEQTIEHLSSFGVDEVILAVNYMADQLRQHFGDEYGGVRIRYSLESQPLGTGGPIALARHYYDKNEPFVAMNGDILSAIDLHQMKKLHESNDVLVTIALHEVDDPTRFGVVRLDERSRIRDFVEKPSLADAPSKLVNAGVYLIEPQTVDRIPVGRKVIIEREVFPILAAEGELCGYVHPGTWFDIGNMSDFRNANFALLESKTRGGLLVGDAARISSSATLAEPIVVSDGAIIEDGARLGPRTIVGRRVRICTDASVRTSVVFDDVHIGSDCSVEGAILGNCVTIGNGVVIEEGSVVAGYTKIRDNIRIARNVCVHPYKEIDEDILTSGHVV